LSAFGTLDSNYYCRPALETKTVIRVAGSATTWNTIAEWRTYSGKDAHTNVTPFAATEFIFDFNATLNNKVVTGLSGYKDLDNNTVTGYTLMPFSSIILIK